VTIYSVPSFISILALLSAFILMWRERQQFQSLFLIRIAVAFLTSGRVLDLMETFLADRSVQVLEWSFSPSRTLLSGVGNIVDAAGLLLLVYGFIKTIRFEREEEKLIHSLETLLPLCAWCKKYRTESGDWKPIETYLKESGAPAITHGICPDCAATRMNASAQRRLQ